MGKGQPKTGPRAENDYATPTRDIEHRHHQSTVCNRANPTRCRDQLSTTTHRSRATGRQNRKSRQHLPLAPARNTTKVFGKFGSLPEQWFLNLNIEPSQPGTPVGVVALI
jgi:hypothetical protein